MMMKSLLPIRLIYSGDLCTYWSQRLLRTNYFRKFFPNLVPRALRMRLHFSRQSSSTCAHVVEHRACFSPFFWSYLQIVSVSIFMAGLCGLKFSFPFSSREHSFQCTSFINRSKTAVFISFFFTHFQAIYEIELNSHTKSTHINSFPRLGRLWLIRQLLLTLY